MVTKDFFLEQLDRQHNIKTEYFDASTTPSSTAVIMQQSGFHSSQRQVRFIALWAIIHESVSPLFADLQLHPTGPHCIRKWDCNIASHLWNLIWIWFWTSAKCHSDFICRSVSRWDIWRTWSNNSRTDLMWLRTVGTTSLRIFCTLCLFKERHLFWSWNDKKSNVFRTALRHYSLKHKTYIICSLCVVRQIRQLLPRGQNWIAGISCNSFVWAWSKAVWSIRSSFSEELYLNSLETIDRIGNAGGHPSKGSTRARWNLHHSFRL